MAAFAAPVCDPGSTCDISKVGPFLQHVNAACYNTGDCQLGDIMTVVCNVGNWILGIIGVLVFAMYVYAGMKLLLAGAHPDWIKQGKDMIKTSTIGLVIVFMAYAAVHVLTQVLTAGTVYFDSTAIQCGALPKVTK